MSKIPDYTPPPLEDKNPFHNKITRQVIPEQGKPFHSQMERDELQREDAALPPIDKVFRSHVVEAQMAEYDRLKSEFEQIVDQTAELLEPLATSGVIGLLGRGVDPGSVGMLEVLYKGARQRYLKLAADLGQAFDPEDKERIKSAFIKGLRRSYSRRPTDDFDSLLE